MGEAVCVGVPQCIEHVRGRTSRALDRQHALAAQHLAQRFPRHERHHEPGVPDLAQEAVGSDGDRELGM